jgi:serine protease AprX
MKKLVLLIILFYAGAGFAQEDAWVYFTDKPDSASYLANPLEMLSQKALDRRAAQGIALDDKDVPIHQEYIDGIASAEGITVMAKSKWLNAVHIRGSVDAISALAVLDFVASIDFANNQLNTAGRYAMDNATASVNKVLDTETDFSYGDSANQVEMLNGHILHQQDFTGTGMTIAVLDAGFPGVDTTQPFERLFENNLILGGYNFISQSEDIYTGGTHGTRVLSTMGGYTEGQLVGSAPDAFYYLFVTENVDSENPVEESYWVEAAEMADSLGVDVINTSLGYFSYDNPGYNYTYEDMDGETAFITRGANIAFTRGIFCVTSAGNNGNTTTPHIGVPADAFNTLTVGAVDANEVKANFSSLGPSYDLRIKPDVMARGVVSINANEQGVIAGGNGTSFASPITAGLVACLWQALPDKTNAQLLQLIKESSDRYNNPNNAYGYGIPDFSMAMQNGLGIKDSIRPKFVLYPNPSKALVNIQFPHGTQNASITLFNSLGQLVLRKEVSLTDAVFSVSALNIGVYSFRFEASGISQTGRIIKE